MELVIRLIALSRQPLAIAGLNGQITLHSRRGAAGLTVAILAEDKRVSLFIATPAYNNQVYASFTTCLLNLVMEASRRGISVYFAHTVSSSLITKARNILTRRFLASDYTHLLFIDADMTFRAADVLRLLDADADVIAAICPRKQIDWNAVADYARRHPGASGEEVSVAGASYGTYQVLNDQPFSANSPVEVASIGTGIMLIKRRVFEQLRRAPGHRIVQEGADAGEEIFFDTEFSDGHYISEDIAFCHRFRAAGGRIFGAPWFRVGHIGNYEFVGDLPGGGA